MVKDSVAPEIIHIKHPSDVFHQMLERKRLVREAIKENRIIELKEKNIKVVRPI